MKTLKNQFKPLTLILGILILLQSCVVYKSESSTFEEAVKAKTKVKLHTITNENLKFKEIIFENGQYFGIKKSNGEMTKILLDRTKYNKLLIKDKATSIIFTIPAILVGLTALGGLGMLIGGGFM